MRAVLSITCLLTTTLSISVKTQKKSIFRPEQIIFSSHFNITGLMVPSDSSQYIPTDSSDIPSIFFSVSDPNAGGNSCIYVLEGYAAYEVLEGGRDATVGFGKDTTVYFGAYDGVYEYIPNSLSAKKFGPFRDDIIQLQKGKDIDVIYFLTSEHKLYKIENKGMIRTKLDRVFCALQFVLDTSNNLYYLSCEDYVITILKTNGVILTVNTDVDDFINIKLLRPAFMMEESIPFFGDNYLFFLYQNGTSQKKDLYFEEMPSAFSVDAGLYIVAAMNGKIYEFNVMDMLLRSMFGFKSDSPADFAKIVVSFIDTSKKNLGYIFNHDSQTEI